MLNDLPLSLSHMTFLGQHPHGQRHGMHDPKAFNTHVVAAVDEALDARADSSQRSMRTPPPCRYYTKAGLPMADGPHWHEDCPLPLQPSHHLDKKPQH
jgi:hypothetical protein